MCNASVCATLTGTQVRRFLLLTSVSGLCPTDQDSRRRATPVRESRSEVVWTKSVLLHSLSNWELAGLATVSLDLSVNEFADVPDDD